MELSLAVFMLFTFTGCSGSGEIYPPPSGKYPFKEKMKVLLGSNLEIIDSINKHEVQISYFEFIIVNKNTTLSLEEQTDDFLGGLAVSASAGRIVKAGITVPLNETTLTSSGTFGIEGGIGGIEWRKSILW